ncbi:sensor histidine kinase [Rothia nasimurium]|uniref:sensor histidine kinase n=1 Tax=Rothia nasimurium TaxID=85336 RepID=UPI003BA38DCF
MINKTAAPRAPKRKAPKQYSGSVRLRIIAWMVLVVTIIVTGLIFVVRGILINEVGSNADASIQSEINEFRNYSDIGVDPATAQPFTGLNDMMTSFINSQATGYREEIIGVTPSMVISRDEKTYAHDEGYHPNEDVTLITAITDNPETSGIEQTPAGPVHWGKVDITLNTDAGTETGHLIIVEFIQPELDAAQHTMITMIWVGLGGLAVSFGIAWIVASRITKPIRSLRTVAQEINDKNFSGRVHVRGDDDVAAMGHTFNQMLDRLEESAMLERQFMDDVSHELRTPITIVRGHLELMDRNEEQDQTLKLVDDELERMARIVSDLLTLAKSERPDFVTPHLVDVADLMITLDSKVQAFTSHHWAISEIAEGQAQLDEQRVTQALVQLCANAAQYAPEGSTVSLGSKFEGKGDDRVLNLWVRDRGPGVTPEDAATLFERFKRNNKKNPATATKHSIGAGLGLAIVRSIAEAHNGSVWIAQPDDEIGSIFGLTLPAPEGTTNPKHDTEMNTFTA